MSEHSNDKLAKVNKEVEDGFMQTALETQLSNLTTRIPAVESHCKMNGRQTPSHEKARFADMKVNMLRTR